MEDNHQYEVVVSRAILQERIHDSPDAYRDDFFKEYAALEAELDNFSNDLEVLDKDIVMFIANTAVHYDVATTYVRILIGLLKNCLNVAKPRHLRTILGAIVVMDNRGNFASEREMVYETFLDIISQEDDELSKLIIIHMIKVLSKLVGEKTRWQKIIFAVFKQAKSPLHERRLAFMLISLFVKDVWNDTATANVIVDGLFSKCTKTSEFSARFILGDLRRLHIRSMEKTSEKSMIEFDAIEQKRHQAELVTKISVELMSRNSNSLKNKSRVKVERMKEAAEKNLAKIESQADDRLTLTFRVMDLIYDPYSVCSRILDKVKKPKSPIPYKLKLLLLMVLARLMSKHELNFPGFFSLLSKYINPKQDKITHILTCVVQGVHYNTPVEDVKRITRLIVDQFINESREPQILTIGLNTVREICARNIEALSEDILSDLINYKTDTSVTMASKSLRNLYRIKAPMMLPTKYRGRGTVETMGLGHDENKPTTLIPGLDILLKLKRLKDKNKDSLDPIGDKEAMEKLQSSIVLRNSDFAALRRINVKMTTARSLGMSLAQWADRENAWDDLADSVLTQKRTREDDEEEEDPAKKKRQLDVDSDEVAYLSSDEESINDESDSDEMPTRLDGIVTENMIAADQKLSRSESRGKLKEVKKNRKTSREVRQLKKTHTAAGVTNRTAARNKPMSMVRFKRSVKEKRLVDAKSKVENLRSHIKTLKTQIKQKLRC